MRKLRFRAENSFALDHPAHKRGLWDLKPALSALQVQALFLMLPGCLVEIAPNIPRPETPLSHKQAPHGWQERAEREPCHLQDSQLVRLTQLNVIHIAPTPQRFGPPPLLLPTSQPLGGGPVWSLSLCKRDPPFSALARATAIIFMITQLGHSDFPSKWGEKREKETISLTRLSTQ